MTRKIQWVRDAEHVAGDPDCAGYWESSEGRFEISPLFIGRTTAQSYRVVDFFAKVTQDPMTGVRTVTSNYSTEDTVREAKAWALRQVNKDS